MAGAQVKPCARNPQPARSLQSMACQTATAKGWQYGPLDAKNSQQQIQTSWNGVASPPTHGPAGMAPKTNFHWGGCRPAVHVRQQLEHHSYLSPLPTGPVHPTGLVVQRQNQGENGWLGYLVWGLSRGRRRNLSAAARSTIISNDSVAPARRIEPDTTFSDEWPSRNESNASRRSSQNKTRTSGSPDSSRISPPTKDDAHLAR
ncbi:hypothetical protein CEP52_017798 [Fusarium oligoseptatum]|uniref:Uncharacterized protein n=1 Tax=Fusarium oligoseptatum TaxID=2604345 RepID=A0A428RFG6_9HYPO|nr:hypothetical protein CEP52_017798 [Fusarium oligoseptatum]